MSRYETFHRPPRPQDVDLHEVWAAIQLEAERQLYLFHEEPQPDAQEAKLRMMESGIANMVLRGAARVQEDGNVLFWNPFEGGFQEYDEEYNQTMLSLMRDFVGASS